MATTRSVDQSGRSTNPLFNDNLMKLGTFCTNCSYGTVASTAEGTFKLSWPNTKALAVSADRAGFEALVPVGRWKGFGGEMNNREWSFETLTYAAALAGFTRDIALFSTVHVPVIHPIVAATQA